MQPFRLDFLLLYTHTCPVTEFAVASHLNTANSCCHHVFLRHFRFQKCLPVYSNSESVRFYIYSSFFSSPCPAWRLCSKCTSSTEISAGDTPAIRDA